jgi:hypothetical protein
MNLSSDEYRDILPRYIRIAKNRDLSSTSNFSVESLKKIKWMNHFGEWYCSQGSYELPMHDVIQHGMYPMDISSALPITILSHFLLRKYENLQDICPKILDLCCCPGSKFLLTSDWLQSHFARSFLVGVDISVERLQVCKSLIDKWTNISGISLSHQNMLFQCDGTTFGQTNLGNLIYDSKVWHQERNERKYSFDKLLKKVNHDKLNTNNSYDCLKSNIHLESQTEIHKRK